ncbi:MAG: hypothetical protein DWQ06_05250 [Calditrichaeota bacterium]|nr:MAG: hypothetical protein DWQ06_05250 [Calditrichota bacterium]
MTLRNLILTLFSGILLFACGDEETQKGTISGSVPSTDSEILNKKVYLIKPEISSEIEKLRQQFKDLIANSAEQGDSLRALLIAEDEKLENERQRLWKKLEKTKQAPEARKKFDNVLFKKFETTVQAGSDPKLFSKYLETYSSSIGLAPEVKKEAEKFFLGELSGIVRQITNIIEKRKKIDEQLKDGTETGGGVNIQKTVDEYNTRLRNLILAHSLKETSIKGKRGSKFSFTFENSADTPLPKGNYYIYLSHSEDLWFVQVKVDGETKTVNLNSGKTVGSNFLFSKDNI